MADPIVFLDFDGVLNSVPWYERRRALRKEDPAHPLLVGPQDTASLDPDAVERLDWLCRRTGAAVVFTTAWRTGQPERLEELLRVRGFTGKVLGETPDCLVRPDGSRVYLSHDRWSEVRTWMERHGEPDRFVLLDDEDWRGFPADRFVRTDPLHGLTLADCQRAERILGGDRG